MADLVLRQDSGVPRDMQVRYKDMGDGTHALVTAVGSIESHAVPTGAPVVGQVTIAVTGTALRLVADSLPLPGGSVLLWADTNNAAAMTAGKTGLGNEADGTGDGVVIPTSGIAILVFADDLRDVWVNGTAGDWLSYSAG